MMRLDRPAQIVVAVSFLLMLAVPHIVEFSGGHSSTAAVEKRAMAKRPDSGLLLESFSEFAGQFEKYYNDSFGLRDDLIRWNNRLRLWMFDESPVKGVRVGRDGWLFYANEWALDDYENVMPYKPLELTAIRKIVDERRAWLEQRGIKLFIIVAPDKHTIYGEYLPPVVHKIGKESRIDQVADELKLDPGIELIDVREALFRAKLRQRLYHRTDTHWNDYGAFIGYNELMERIALYFPNVKRLSLDDYTVSVTEGEGGDLAGMLSLSDLIKEERITLAPKFIPRAVDGRRPYSDPVDIAQYPGRDMIVKETGDPRLPKALVFRDSFSWPLIPFLAESFRSVVFIWNFDFMPEIIEREKPDLIILECVGRYINALAIENPAAIEAELSLNGGASLKDSPTKTLLDGGSF
jgi:alginate O-acetyltransferase complex protein AlgJ